MKPSTHGPRPDADSAPGGADGDASAPPTRAPHSLFGEILDWMLAPLLLLWPMSIFLTYLVAQGISDKPYDRELAVVVRAIARQVGSEMVAGGTAMPVPLQVPGLAAEFLRAEDTDRVYIQVLGGRGEFLAGDAGLPLPDEVRRPTGEVYFREDVMRDEAVRVAYLWMPVTDGTGERAMLWQNASA